ncbi:hypothetical protein B7L66_24740 (plasmid) [Xanthomonas citri pv. citri]|uniref:Uncharacterized protein n=3 Tax=Xanthomonas TaxID=338 RepID=A0A7Z7IY81_XANCH|nr:hypothetical protein B7L66_24740 [Xanthomonas citri pv. citri]ARR19996.1 hypothetical protein B7L65_24390 [Xanthomonas citri pv. citri]ARR24721.1 hypothetical protein B7L67_24845 [Xanthomonas citri pv. citri]ATS86844.1 hypothetical protein XcfCFBP6991P_23455 [Xanthomonas citri pv. phaseoli var. fuscans]SOO23807.1 hypothetical protein XFF6991_30127 [Xanthomonas phaseoli pv. phaseoli]
MTANDHPDHWRETIAPGTAALWMQRNSWGAFLGSVYARVERVTAKRVTIRVFNDLSRQWERKSVRATNLHPAHERHVLELEKLESAHPYRKAPERR